MLLNGTPGWAQALGGLFGVYQGIQQGNQARAQQDIERQKAAQNAALLQAQIANFTSLAKDRDLTRNAKLLGQGLDPDAHPLPALEDTPTTAPAGTPPGPVQASPLGAAAVGTGAGAAAAEAPPTPVDTPSVVTVPHPTLGQVPVVTTPSQNLPKPVAPGAKPPAKPAGVGQDARVPGSIMDRLGPIPTAFASAPGQYGQPFRDHAQQLQDQAAVIQKKADAYRAAGRSDQAQQYSDQAKALITEAGKAMTYGNEADLRGQAFENAVWQRYSGVAQIMHWSDDTIAKVKHDIQTEAQAVVNGKQTLQLGLGNIAAKWGAVDATNNRTGAMVQLGNQSNATTQRGQDLAHGDRVTGQALTRRGQDLAHPQGFDRTKPLSDKDMASAVRGQMHNLANNGMQIPNDPTASAVINQYVYGDPATRAKMEQGMTPDGQPISAGVLRYIRPLGMGLPPYAGKGTVPSAAPAAAASSSALPKTKVNPANGKTYYLHSDQNYYPTP